MGGIHPGIPGGVEAAEVAGDVAKSDLRGDEASAICPRLTEDAINLLERLPSLAFHTLRLVGGSLPADPNHTGVDHRTPAPRVRHQSEDVVQINSPTVTPVKDAMDPQSNGRPGYVLADSESKIDPVCGRPS